MLDIPVVSAGFDASINLTLAFQSRTCPNIK